MTPADPLLRYRERFAITARANYVISNSLGAMPAAARASVGRFLDQWDTRGVRCSDASRTASGIWPRPSAAARAPRCWRPCGLSSSGSRAGSANRSGSKAGLI
jgi:hypothetical protein